MSVHLRWHLELASLGGFLRGAQELDRFLLLLLAPEAPQPHRRATLLQEIPKLEDLVDRRARATQLHSPHQFVEGQTWVFQLLLDDLQFQFLGDLHPPSTRLQPVHQSPHSVAAESTPVLVERRPRHAITTHHRGHLRLRFKRKLTEQLEAYLEALLGQVERALAIGFVAGRSALGFQPLEGTHTLLDPTPVITVLLVAAVPDPVAMQHMTDHPQGARGLKTKRFDHSQDRCLGGLWPGCLDNQCQALELRVLLLTTQLRINRRDALFQEGVFQLVVLRARAAKIPRCRLDGFPLHPDGAQQLVVAHHGVVQEKRDVGVGGLRHGMSHRRRTFGEIAELLLGKRHGRYCKWPNRTEQAHSVNPQREKPSQTSSYCMSKAYIQKASSAWLRAPGPWPHLRP